MVLSSKLQLTPRDMAIREAASQLSSAWLHHPGTFRQHFPRMLCHPVFCLRGEEGHLPGDAALCGGIRGAERTVPGRFGSQLLGPGDSPRASLGPQALLLEGLAPWEGPPFPRPSSCPLPASCQVREDPQAPQGGVRDSVSLRGRLTSELCSFLPSVTSHSSAVQRGGVRGRPAHPSAQTKALCRGKALHSPAHSGQKCVVYSFNILLMLGVHSFTYSFIPLLKPTLFQGLCERLSPCRQVGHGPCP